MNKWQKKYLVWITLLILAVLFFIQVRWIDFSIRFQEKVFRNSVDLALDKSISNLVSDRMVCNAMRECMCGDTLSFDSRFLTQGIWDQIHSVIDEELAVYNIDLAYDLFITKNGRDTIRSGPINLVVKKGPCYTQSLRNLLQTSGYELVVRFPDRTRFFFNEVGIMLLSSLILILLVVFLFVEMVKLYRNESRLAENTRELINNITHEFKTPLSSISLASNLIRKGRQESAKMQEYGDLIYHENQKLQHQVESILDMAAIEWEEFEYHKRNESLNDLVIDALHSVKMLAEERKGIINTQLMEGDDTLEADKLHLTNSIANLLTNALKYSEEIPSVGIRTYPSDQYLALEIRDNGIGIPGKYHKRIFEKYFRVPTGDVHDIKGFGIGLSYVKNVVTAHQGRIKVESEPGKGSVFTVFLPKSSWDDE